MRFCAIQLSFKDDVEGPAKNVYVHRKNIIGSTLSNHLDLGGGCHHAVACGLEVGGGSEKVWFKMFDFLFGGWGVGWPHETTLVFIVFLFGSFLKPGLIMRGGENKRKNS